MKEEVREEERKRRRRRWEGEREERGRTINKHTH